MLHFEYQAHSAIHFLSLNSTTMEIAFFKMLIIASVSGEFKKHVYVQNLKTWPEAQKYCKEHHTDLSPISGPRDEWRLKNKVYDEVKSGFWIGLYREPGNLTGWKWSGGGYASYMPWAYGQPNNSGNHTTYVRVCWNSCHWPGWYDFSQGRTNFFCLNLIVVEEKKTWVEALEHCRKDHTELTSLVSETELLLAQREIQEAQTTDHVWIGLSYLGDEWMWVNGDRLEYEAWPQGGDQDCRCPAWSRSCGALTKEGLWENRDCQEKLSFICY